MERLQLGGLGAQQCELEGGVRGGICGSTRRAGCALSR
jgi:hypothetical protein